jgi:hydroxymethylglutaryl-CoA lyase
VFEKLPKRVNVVEVGPRDGLQNEPNPLAQNDKIQLIDSLGRTGLKHIEVTSFVSPKWIPQLADGLAVAKGIKLPDDIITSALVPNAKGFESFKQTNLKEVALFMSATESHSKKNINKSIDEALETVKSLIPLAKAEKKRVRAYLSVVFVCPYEGKVKAEKVVPLVEKLFSMGVDEVSLGDTIGAATPNDVHELISLLSAKLENSHIDKTRIALHFHDTCGTALVNVMAGLAAGITTFDASIGGMGGCPYAPGASGNLATEDLVYLLHSLGIETGIDLDRLIESGSLAQKLLGKVLPGRYLRYRLSQNPQSVSFSRLEA